MPPIFLCTTVSLILWCVSVIVTRGHWHTVGTLVNSFLAALFASAFVFIQCYISGTRMAFSLPAYGLLALAGLLSFFGNSERIKRAGACLAATAFLFTYVLVRAGTSPVEYLARTDMLMVLACLIVYFLTVRHFAAAHLRAAILVVMFALVVAEVIIGAQQFAYGNNWMPFGLIRPPSGQRASGMFISSIHLAGLLEALGPFALAIALWGTKKTLVRILAGYIALMCYFGVGITGSRGGWLSSIFSLGVFTCFGLDVIRRTNRALFPGAVYITFLAAPLLMTGAFLLGAQSKMIQERMVLLGKITETHKDGAYDVRIYNWQAALDQWRDAKWTGTGSGTHLYYGRLYRRPQLQADPEHAHCDYLELLAEYGIIGAAGMAFFLLAHLRRGFRGYNDLLTRHAEEPHRSSLELGLQVGALSAVSAYLAHSVVDFNLHLPGNALLFAFIFGILANPGYSPGTQEDSTTKQRGHFLPRLLLPALGLWLAVAGLPKLRGEIYCEKARVALREGLYRHAIDFANRGLQSEKKNPFLYLRLGQAHRLNAMMSPRSVRKTDLELAEKAFRSGLDLFPQDEALWIRLGQTLDALADYKNARIAYETALQLDPNLGIIYAYYAEHLKTVGREGEAEEAIAKGQRLTPKNLSTYFDTPLANEAPEASGE